MSLFTRVLAPFRNIWTFIRFVRKELRDERTPGYFER